MKIVKPLYLIELNEEIKKSPESDKKNLEIIYLLLFLNVWKNLLINLLIYIEVYLSDTMIF